MAQKDYYKSLGVAKDAGADEIKKAYRKLAMKYHPDHSAGDKAKEEKFNDIQKLLSKWGTMLLDVSHYLKPFLPDAAKKIEDKLREHNITKAEPLFPRLN